MAATFANLVFSVAFLMMMSACTIFAFLSEKQSLRLMRMIDVHVASIVDWSFSRREDGQAASQPRPIVSVISQPVVRIAA